MAHITVVPTAGSGGGSGVDPGAVHYTGDTPTTGQQQTARTTIAAAQRLAPTVVRTSAHAVNLGDLDNNDTTGVAYSITAPSATAPAGAVFGVKKLDTGTNILTVAAQGSDVFVTKSASGTLTTATSVTFTVQETRIFVCDGASKWYVLDGHITLSSLDARYVGSYTFRTFTTAGTAVSGNYILADTTAGTFAIAAPTPTAGVRWGVKWVAGTVPPTVTGTLNTAYTFSSLLQSDEFVSDGTKWYRASVEPPQDLSAYALSSDLAGHVSQTYHSGGITYVDWNSVSWPTTRPASAGKVLVTGVSSGAGNTRPSWFQPGDLFIVPSAPVTTYLASNNFEGYVNGNPVLIGQSNGSGDAFDLSAGGTGSTRLAESNTTGGETIVMVSTTPSGAGVTSYVGWNTTVGQLTGVTLGAKWISPASLPAANLQLLRTRINNSGTLATAPALRINSGTGKFEVLDAAGVVAWTSTTVFSAAVAWYILELRIDCAGGHLQAFITPATGTPETLGDMTTAKSTGAHVDEFVGGVVSSLTAGTAQRFDWLRVADVATRVNQ